MIDQPAMNGPARQDGRFDEPIAACPLCGCERIGQTFTIDTYTPAFTVARCSVCGFMFMNPRFTAETIHGLYTEDYYSGKSEYSYYDERDAEKYARHVWDARIRVIRRYQPGGNFLDVGSAFGGLLSAAAKYFSPHGIEISPFAAEHSRTAPENRIHNGTLDYHPFPADFFSVITMIELIEHLPDPRKAIRECFRLLKPGGLLVVQTANMEGLQARILGKDYAYYMPGHLSYFSMRNLVMALRLCGFRTVRVFYPVEFGLIPKLKKSRYGFSSPWDYRTWFRISAYHFISKIHIARFAATSSMVIYAFK